MSTIRPTLVLGLGNQLLADEGVGVHAAQALIEAGSLPDHVTVVDVGTAILDALDELESAERLVLVDAMKADGEPGTIYQLPLEDCDSASCIASLHGFDIQRALAMVGRSDLPEVWVIGVEPARIEWSLDLSPPVAAALPRVLAVVERLVREMGY